MLRSIELVMEDYLAGQRCSRDYYIKFPDEIRQENLGVQLWFAAEVRSVYMPASSLVCCGNQ